MCHSPELFLSSGGGGLRNDNRHERSQGRPLLPGHGTFSTSKVGGWQLVVGGGWRTPRHRERSDRSSVADTRGCAFAVGGSCRFW